MTGIRGLRPSALINILSPALVAIFICLSFLVGDVKAVSNVAPHAADFIKSTGISNAESTGHTMRLVVDQTGAQIDASIVALYLPVTSTSWAITITDADTCGLYDLGSQSTNYELETYTPVDGFWITNAAGGGCPDGRTVVFNLTRAQVQASAGGGFPETFSNGVTYYKVKLRATIPNINGNSNGFGVQVPVGGYVSFYSQSSNKFALQDRQPEPDSQWRYTDYTLRFAPSCDVNTNRPATLHWYDDDWGSPASLAIQRNFNSGEHYRMVLREYNRASGALTNTWFINTNGANNAQSYSTSPAWLSTTGMTGNQATASATFTIRPNHRYTWTWYHVRKANAIQFQVPYDSIFWQFSCGNWDYEPSYETTGTTPTTTTIYPSSTISLTGDAQNVGTVTGPNHALRIVPAATAAANVALTGNPHSGSVSGDTITWNSLGAIAPGAAGGANRTVVYTVNAGAAPGTQLCFRVDAYPDNQSLPTTWDTTGTGNNRCYTVTAPPAWNYVPQTPTGPPDTATGPKPGDTLAINGAVLNNGTGTGAAYTHRIMVGPSSTGPWTTTGGWTSSESAIGAGATRTRTLNYTIPVSATNGSQVCFLTSANPVAGVSAPSITITNSSTRFSTPLCYTIYNLRFNMEDPVIGPGPSTRFVSPGDSVAPTFSVENTGNGPTPPATSANRVRVEYSSNVHAPGSPNLSATSTPAPIPAGADHAFSGSGTIPSSAVVGSQYCVSARALPQEGYSDGTGTSGVTATTQYCYVVTNAPYLKVYGNDSWAGFEFSNTSATNGCTPGRGLVSSVNGSPTNVGASDEYAVFGMGNIDSFGTANSPLSHLMKFANTPTHGNYGANRCVADYFNLLDDAAVNLPTGVNSLNGQGGGQYIVNGNISTRTLNGLNNYNNQHTVLVDGDLIINGNVVYTNSYARDDVPILIFVVRGNIFINENVRQLDGIYIAINGIIETCSTDSTIGDFDPVGAPANGSGVCDEPLEVNGTFIAQDIYFKRTGGGINEASTGNNVSQRCSQGVLEGGGNDERCAAEIFRFSPEAYLARPFFDIGQPENTLEILQLRDLPPVF